MYRKSCRLSLVVVFVFLTGLFLPGSLVPALADPQTTIQDLDQAYVQIAQKVSPAVVRVSSTKSVPASSDQGLEPFFKQFPFLPFGEQMPKQFRQSPHSPHSLQLMMGSGFIVSSDGLIMTNNHVVKDMKDIKVTLPGKQEYKAKLVAADPDSDVALIRIAAKNLPTITWGDSAKLKVGEIVMAIGNPFGLSGTVTKGIVSATGRNNVGIESYEDFIQTDAPINPGNSGGPLVNIRGDVIGINTAIATQSGGYMGVGFAIPSDTAKAVMEQLLKHGKVERGLLGVNIQDLNQALAKSFGRTDTNGALVAQVVPESAAAKAGIKTGDIILDYNGTPITDASQLRNLVGATKPGSQTKLKIWRDKKAIEVSATLAERTAKAVEAAAPATAEASSELGITVEKVSPELASKLGLKEGTGIVIKEVDPSGHGAAMGLKQGDVILEVDGHTVSSVSEFNKQVSDAKKAGVIRMMIQRGSATIFLAESF
jgi:serine protease Do